MSNLNWNYLYDLWFLLLIIEINWIIIDLIILTFQFLILIIPNDQWLYPKFRLDSKFVCLFILEVKELDYLLIVVFIFLVLNLMPLFLPNWAPPLLIALIFHLKFMYRLVVFLFLIQSLTSRDISLLPLAIFFDFKLFYN